MTDIAKYNEYITYEPVVHLSAIKHLFIQKYLFNAKPNARY